MLRCNNVANKVFFLKKLEKATLLLLPSVYFMNRLHSDINPCYKQKINRAIGFVIYMENHPFPDILNGSDATK
jgi:hypothetical protein